MTHCDVLIPFFGESKYLRECLKSIELQHLDNISLNVTVVNDNPDLVLKNLSINNPYVSLRIINNTENLGMAKNWNKCLALNTNEYFHLLHYDDLLRSDFYNIMITRLGANTSCGIRISNSKNKFENIFSSRYWGSKFKKSADSTCIALYNKGDEAVRAIMNSKFVCSSVILTKNAISNSGFFKEDLLFSTDEEYWARVAKNNDLLITNEELVEYRFHNRNYSLKTWVNSQFADLFIQTRMARLDLLSNKSQEDVKIENKKIALLFINIAYKLYLKGDKKWSKFYLGKASEVFPEVTDYEQYKKIQRRIDRHPFLNLFEKFKSAH